jgi:hypothetical protein
MILLARGKRVPYSIFKHASSVCGTFILQRRVRTADAPTDAFQDSSKMLRLEKRRENPFVAWQV